MRGTEQMTRTLSEQRSLAAVEALAGVRPLVTVLAHGCFDLLHAGHIEHLQEAKRRGDRLVVSVSGDAFVAKGAWRPQFNAEQRAAHLRALRCVDDVIINNDGPSAVPAIERVRPQIYIKGPDYDGADNADLREEIAAVERCGGHFETTQTAQLSSSRMLTQLRHGDVVDYLASCRARDFWPRIAHAFEQAQKLRVAFVGETIIDEYRFVTPLGKPSKEFVLAVAEESVEVFEGGVMAAAAHASKLCETSVVTQQKGDLKKTRFVGKDFGQKLFEVYSAPYLRVTKAAREWFLEQLEVRVRQSDVVVALDFGHGLIDDLARGILQQARFLAVNAQSNAGNQGFNPITRYDHPHYACVDINEARLATHMQPQESSISQVIAELISEISPLHLLVTGGRHGAYWRGGQVPALATAPKDTIGAGDAFLAVTAPLLAVGLGEEEAAFVGNVAGAMKTEIVGHRKPIDGDVLVQTVKSLLK